VANLPQGVHAGIGSTGDAHPKISLIISKDDTQRA
jgi:hypothetical protein